MRRLLPILLVTAACGSDDESFEHIGTSEDAVVVCPDGPTLKGIDVSYYQGNVDWQAVKDSGRVFAFARVNHGSFIDPEFQDNWGDMKAAGIIRGAYQFFDPSSNAIDQAQILIDRVGMLGPGDLPAVLDIEQTEGASAATIATRVQNWMAAVEQGTGKKPIIYTGKYFWNSNVHSDAFNDHPLWVANWFVDCPDLPADWNDWVFWQHSDSGSVPGISGAVDLDRFNGSLAMLEAFAGKVFAAELAAPPDEITLAPGDTATARIVLANVGAKTWGAKVALGTTKPRDRKSAFADDGWIDATRIVAVEGTVAPGDEYTFEFTVRAPDEPGAYTEHFNLVHEEAGWFSEPPQGGPEDGTISLRINVMENDDDGTPPPEGGETLSGGVDAEIDAQCHMGRSRPGLSLMIFAALFGLFYRRSRNVMLRPCERSRSASLRSP